MSPWYESPCTLLIDELGETIRLQKLYTLWVCDGRAVEIRRTSTFHEKLLAGRSRKMCADYGRDLISLAAKRR